MTTRVILRFNPYTENYVWTYGNYGGPGWTGGKFTPPGQKSDFEPIPQDKLDNVFKSHDSSYEKARGNWDQSNHTQSDINRYWDAIRNADNQMLDSMNDLRISGELGPATSDPYLAAVQADVAFRVKKAYEDAAGQRDFNPDDTSPKPGGDPYTGMPWPGDPDDWSDRFGDAERTTSPLVLDLNGDGVQTTRLSKSFTQGVHFNLDAKGLAENTAWVSKEDGLLVHDLNADGKITSGRELFGNHTLLTKGSNAGKEAANGFEALAELDDNNDGMVDAKDTAFNSLKVWKDTNGNGITDAGELLTLAQAGVKSFTVSYTSTDSTDANGNQHLQMGHFTQTDNTTQNMNDVWFNVDTARTAETDLLAVNDEIADLPDLSHIGNLRSLDRAIFKQVSPMEGEV